MSNLTVLKQQCLDEIERAFTIAEEHFNVRLERAPVKFNNKLKKCAGKAVYLRNSYKPVEIRLSLPVMALNPQEFVSNTPAHEAAHLISIQVYGAQGQGHGPRWKSIMMLIGRSTARCHRMETAPTTKHRKYKYIATCGTEIELSAIRHSKVQRGAVYTLTRTRGKIQRSGLATTTRSPEPIFAIAASTPKPKKAKKVTKASIVRNYIVALKEQGVSLDRAVNHKDMVIVIAEASKTTINVCKMYLRKYWDEVNV